MTDITNVKESFTRALQETTSLEATELLRIKYLGRKGEINTLLDSLKNKFNDEKSTFGKEINALKLHITEAIKGKEDALAREYVEKNLKEIIDVTEPGVRPNLGHIHPVTRITWEMMDAFSELGYEITQGPEIETDYYNFEVLNIPKDHPARDLQDTFWLTNGLVPRTHTSSMQVRVMEKMKPPFKIAVPGWVYRQEREDTTHAAFFQQFEGFVVGKQISFADLKGTLFTLLKKILGESTELKFRASYFPYVEPCAEVSATCPHCKGKGCNVCKKSGWIEILGSGMIHPVVLQNAHIDPNEYSGFAFAFGLNRLAMIKYKIDDMRLFTSGDMRFLKQF